MSIIGLLVVLICFGVGLYLIGLIPMDATVRRIIQVLAILFLVLWLLQNVGLLGPLPDLRLR